MYLFDVLWHYADELCYIQRRLRDLNDTNRDALNSCVVHLHTYCPTAARAGSLMELDIAQEGTRQETHSVSDTVGKQLAEDMDQERNTKHTA